MCSLIFSCAHGIDFRPPFQMIKPVVKKHGVKISLIAGGIIKEDTGKTFFCSRFSFYQARHQVGKFGCIEVTMITHPVAGNRPQHGRADGIPGMAVPQVRIQKSVLCRFSRIFFDQPEYLVMEGIYHVKGVLYLRPPKLRKYDDGCTKISSSLCMKWFKTILFLFFALSVHSQSVRNFKQEAYLLRNLLN